MRERAIRIVSNVLGYPIEQIDDDTSPDTVKTWDSLRHMKLVLALEEELGVQLTADQIVEMNNVALILAVLDEATAGS